MFMCVRTTGLIISLRMTNEPSCVRKIKKAGPIRNRPD